MLFNFRYVEGLEKMTITEERVAKLVPKRIFGMAIHPSQERVLVAAGGKWGELGMWDVVSSVGITGFVITRGGRMRWATIHLRFAIQGLQYNMFNYISSCY